MRTKMKPEATLYSSERLTILASIAGSPWSTTASIRKAKNISQSGVDNHIAKLKRAGFIRTKKSVDGGRQSVQCAITSAGRIALDEHIEYMESLIAFVLHDRAVTT